jgi:hypothetical protein
MIIPVILLIVALALCGLILCLFIKPFIKRKPKKVVNFNDYIH